MTAEEKGVKEAGQWLAAKWQNLEARYGRKAALTMAVAMLATLPIPGNLAAVVAAAEAIRGVHGYFTKDMEPAMVKAISKGVDDVVAKLNRLYEQAENPSTFSSSQIQNLPNFFAGLSAKEVKEAAEKFGVVVMSNSKGAIIQQVQRRIESAYETAINISFANKPRKSISKGVADKLPIGAMVGLPWNDYVGEGTEYPSVGGEKRMALLGKVYFSKENKLADDAFRQVIEKPRTLGGASIKFMPIGRVAKNQSGGNHYPTWNLIEFTVTPIGSNPDSIPVAVDEENRIVTYIMTTETLDRDGESVDPEGGDFEEFKKNPAILFDHNSGEGKRWEPRCKSVEKDHLSGAAKDAARKAALEDLSNGTSTTNPYSGGENKDVWQAAYDKAQRELRAKSPFWAGAKVEFDIGRRKYAATVIPPGLQQGYVKVKIDTVEGEGGMYKPGMATNIRVQDLRAKSMTTKFYSKGKSARLKSAPDDEMARYLEERGLDDVQIDDEAPVEEGWTEEEYGPEEKASGDANMHLGSALQAAKFDKGSDLLDSLNDAIKSSDGSKVSSEINRAIAAAKKGDFRGAESAIRDAMGKTKSASKSDVTEKAPWAQFKQDDNGKWYFKDSFGVWVGKYDSREEAQKDQEYEWQRNGKPGKSKSDVTDPNEELKRVKSALQKLIGPNETEEVVERCASGMCKDGADEELVSMAKRLIVKGWKAKKKSMPDPAMAVTETGQNSYPKGPPGKTVLDKLKKAIEDDMGSMEQPHVKQALERMLKEIGTAYTKAAYQTEEPPPEVKAEEVDGEEEDDEVETPKGKAKSKRLNKSTMAKLKDIADYLDDAGNAAPKHLGAGMKYHAASLKSMLEEDAPVIEESEEDLSEEDMAAISAALEDNQATMKALRQTYFQATCKKL